MTQVRERLWLGVVLLATFLVYARSIGNGYTYDDASFVKAAGLDGDNLMVRELHPVGDYFQTNYGVGFLRSRGFRPVTVLSFAWTHHAFRSPLPKQTQVGPNDEAYRDPRTGEVWSDAAWPHHLVNVFLHVVCTLLVYLLVRSLLAPGAPALLASALFGLHALHSDPVISVVGRAELLGFAFGATAWLTYLRFSQDSGLRRALLVLPALCLFLAFCSKESSLPWVGLLPVLLVVRAWMADSQTPVLATLRPHLINLWALVVPVVLFFLLRAPVVAHAEAEGFDVSFESNKLFDVGLLERLPTAIYVAGYALGQALWPWPLACDYGAAVMSVQDVSSPRFWVALLVLGAALGAGVYYARRAPLLLAAVAAFFGFAFLVSNIPVPIETIYGERLYYSPLLGLSVLVAWVTRRSSGGRWARPWLGSLAVFLVASSVIVQVRISDWSDSETLFKAEADRNPRATNMHMNVAGIHRRRYEAGDQSALQVWRHHIDIVLANDPGSNRPYVEYGLHHMLAGNLAEAERWLVRSMESDYFEPKRDLATVAPNLGEVYRQSGQLDKAEAILRRGAEVVGRHGPPQLWYQLLWIVHERGDLQAYEKLMAEAAQVYQGQVPPAFGVHDGMLAYEKKQYALAADILGRTLDQAPFTIQVVPGFFARIDSLRRTGQPAIAARLVAALLRDMGNPETIQCSARDRRSLQEDILPRLRKLSRELGKR